jgi:hypothetical protein
MRINTDGKKAYRNDLYEETSRVLGENTKTGGIDAACIHAKQDIRAKEAVLEYLEDKLSPAELQTVAGTLSTDQIELDVEFSTGVSVE